MSYTVQPQYFAAKANCEKNKKKMKISNQILDLLKFPILLNEDSSLKSHACVRVYSIYVK